MNAHLRQIHPLSWTIIIGTIFGRMATSMSIPFLSIYLINRLGASPSQAGIVVAVSSLIGVFASFYGGYISDVIGRKKVLFISIFGWAVVFVGFALADQIWMFFVINALNGLCRAMFEPTSRALLADITPQESKLLVFNLRYAAINLGVVAGPILGLQMGNSNSGNAFYIAGLVYFCYGAVLVAQFLLHKEIGGVTEQSSNRMTLKGALRVTGRDRIFVYVLIGMIFCVLGYGHFSSTLAQYLELSPSFTDGAKWFGYMLSLNAVVVLVVQFPLVRFSSRFSPIVPLIAGNLCVSCSLLIFGLVPNIWTMMLGVILFTIGEVLMFTMTDVLVDRIAPHELRGTYFGMFGFNNLGNVMAPLLGGFLLDAIGVSQPLLIFGIIALTAAFGLPFLFLAKRHLPEEQAQTE
ncbi:putative MFS family arabinose efflux permease [Fontibacillus phaseoli]|uniref:Putative MFS family arabinose efflux permease n=1 Tax=Fontibacillus phaseoli TaxID=1416533 RepID=A0A369BG01_9BACL|nr:MFS transporter [Fontibacillus phaseoli]RCX20479.1 putative MFS family arabinose efflux permease [Fontibacillus phaseoli]